ncbi:MAG: glucans biosynthesis glucosyltransferase MdoH [Hyphomonadaceae bacterium]
MSGLSLAAAERSVRQSAATPPEAPLHMPIQPLDAPRLRPAGEDAQQHWRLALVLTLGAAIAAFAISEMVKLAGFNGLSLLEWLSLTLFAPSILWIATASVTAMTGAAVLLFGRRQRLPAHGFAGNARTAIVFPIYHEDIDAVVRNAEAAHDALRNIGAARNFEIFFLSDSIDPAYAHAEEAAMEDLRRRRPSGAFFYRRRTANHGRKAGNIAEFVRRWGGRYDYMIVFDADSVMTAQAITELVARMEASPRTALIQTVPSIINARTLFARLQQFSLRACGPIFGAGLAWWSGAAGNYWGHNAIIRTRAFAACAGLPELPGRAPIGGTILSHDFIEAAMLRRAGWRVEIAADIAGSYEQCPPTLADMAARDRRWAQGSVQHIGIIGAYGFDWRSRVHILAGIMGYACSTLWCLLLALSVALGFAAQFEAPAPFAALDTPWVFGAHEPARAALLFGLTAALVLSPKWLALALWCADKLPGWPRERRFLAGLALDTLASIAVAPILMAHQTSAVLATLLGRDAGWRPQVRDRNGDAVAQAEAPHMALAALFFAANLALSPAMALWAAPVALSLMFAPQIETRLARIVRRDSRLWRLTETPEEMEGAPSMPKAAVAVGEPDVVEIARRA